MEAIAIFDIGKSNKKFLLFDTNYQVLHQEQMQFAEIQDEDGFPCDDIQAISHWVKKKIQWAINDSSYKVGKINFSTYGASFVHLDEEGKILTPLYNYLKPISEEILASFYAKHGNKLKLAQETASPPLAMLNSGLQLFWLKYSRSHIFKQIKWSLHLPQYFSYLISGEVCSEYTSIGCHTMLWDFEKEDYHRWVYEEGIDQKLPPILSTDSIFEKQLDSQKIQIGIGIHDSSSALLPYIQSVSDPFLLLSTGSWSISINPFNQEILSRKELENDCLNFLSITGKSIKAARLFLGNEYKIQCRYIQKHFQIEEELLDSLRFDPQIFESLQTDRKHYFAFESIGQNRATPHRSKIDTFRDPSYAMHKLMMELLELQVEVIERAIGQTKIQQLIIEGGFAKNDLFVNLLKRSLTKYSLYICNLSQGSALGAAMLLLGKEAKWELREVRFG